MAEQLKHYGKKLRGILLGEDPDHIFSAECENAHLCLQRLLEVGINLPTEEIAATYHQLKNKEIIISIHGRHKCGKSTLINALLGCSLLPMSILNETGVMVKIEHDDTVHEGMCPNYPNGCQHCPKLSMKTSNGSEVHIRGCEKICDRLEQANKEARTARYQERYEFTLTTNVPMLASTQPGWKIIMLDNPGFGESHQEHMTQRTKTTLKTSSAYLVVMDVSQLGDREDEKCLNLIYKGDEGAFDDHYRVLVALTKYDTMYQERKKKRKSEQDVKEVVQKYVQAATCRKISDNAIVPVCGKWALHARLLQLDPSDEHSRDQVEIGLKLADVPCGQEEDTCQREDTRQREDTHQNSAVSLEGKTNIKELERSIQKMTSRCAYIWIDTMTSNYHRYIKAGLHMLALKRDETNGRLRAAKVFREEITKHYETASDVRAKMQKSMQKEQSAIYEQLCMSACSDIQATKVRVIHLVRGFHDKCKGRIVESGQKFGEDELRRDINELLNAEIKPNVVVEICNASERFHNTVECKRTAVRDADNYIKILNEEALKYTEPRPTCQHLPIIVEGGAAEIPSGDEEERELDGIDAVLKKEKLTFDDLQQHLNIPSLEIPWTKAIADRVRALLHSLAPGWVAAPTNIDRSDIVANVMGKLQEMAEAATENYLNEFKQVVTDFFFRKYCESVRSRLHNFQEQLGHKLEQQKSSDDRCTEALGAEVKQLTDEETRLTNHISKITQKAEKYRNALISVTTASKTVLLSPSVQRELEIF